MTDKNTDSLKQIGKLLDTKEPTYLMTEETEQKNLSEKRIEAIEAELEELKELMRDEIQKTQFIDETVPDKISTLRISTSVKAGISREKEGRESLEKTISRVFREVSEYRQIFSELIPLVEREGDAENTLKEIRKVLGM